jgi:hypothetical protein
MAALEPGKKRNIRSCNSVYNTYNSKKVGGLREAAGETGAKDGSFPTYHRSSRLLLRMRHEELAKLTVALFGEYRILLN